MSAVILTDATVVCSWQQSVEPMIHEEKLQQFPLSATLINRDSLPGSH